MNIASAPRETTDPAETRDRPAKTSFRVVPGRVYELQALATRREESGAGLGLAALRLDFLDAAGERVDPAVAGPDFAVPHLDPVRLAAPPAASDLEAIHDAAAAMRFLVAPPDAVRLRLELETPGVELRRAELVALALNWPAQGEATAGDVERIAAAQEALLARLFPPEAEDAGAAAARAATRTHGPEQFRAIAGQFAPTGDWGAVLERSSVLSVREEIDARLGRLRESQGRRPRIGFAGAGRDHARLSAYADLVCLREAEWAAQLASLPLDAVLIGTNPETLLGDWRLAFGDFEGVMAPQARAMVEAAKARGLPVRVHVTVEPGEIGVYRELIEAADAVAIEGDPADWTAPPEGAVFVRRATEPTLHAPLRDGPMAGETLVPVASDVFQVAGFRDFLIEGGSGDLALTEYDYGFVPKALSAILPKTRCRAIVAESHHARARLLKGAAIVLLSGETLRAPGQFEAIALDAVASGAIPVIFGPDGPGRPPPRGLAARLDRVWSAAELQELQRLYRIPWLWERRWRGLWRALFRDHVWTSEERRALLGADPCAEDFDAPLVTAVMVSKRPHYIARCLETFRSQSWPNKELILVLNLDAPPEPAPELRENERMFLAPQSRNIGYCLNMAIAKARGRYWCKMDDDDYYSAHYLRETEHYFRATQSEALGRQSIYFYMAGSDETIARLSLAERTLKLISPGEFISGATLSAKTISDMPRFSVSLRNAVDSEWVKALIEAGLRVASLDSTSMIVQRDVDVSTHTWLRGPETNSAGFSTLRTGNIHLTLEAMS